MRSEHEIQTDILLAFGALPYLRLWRMNTGKAYGYSLVQGARSLLLQGSFQLGMDALKRLPLTTYGQPGAADIQGVLEYRIAGLPIGRFLAIECKKPGEKLTEEQARWGEMVTAFGGLHILATSVEDVRQALKQEGFDA